MYKYTTGYRVCGILTLVLRSCQVEWPLSIVISQQALMRYQLLFRHLFELKWAERDLSAVWQIYQTTRMMYKCAEAVPYNCSPMTYDLYSASYNLRHTYVETASRFSLFPPLFSPELRKTFMPYPTGVSRGP